MQVNTKGDVEDFLSVLELMIDLHTLQLRLALNNSATPDPALADAIQFMPGNGNGDFNVYLPARCVCVCLRACAPSWPSIDGAAQRGVREWDQQRVRL